MGAFPKTLAIDLKRELGLARVIETGTYQGASAVELSEIFERVVTIEISPRMHEWAAERIAGHARIESILGDSRTVLPGLVDPAIPTFYWLDGHWSGGSTGGEEAQCPVVEELEAIAPGHPDDCVVIDDARLFFAPPPPPHDPQQWPTFAEVFDATRAARPNAHVTVAEDKIVAVPGRLKPLVDRWARDALDAAEEEPTRPGGLGRRLADVLRR